LAELFFPLGAPHSRCGGTQLLHPFLDRRDGKDDGATVSVSAFALPRTPQVEADFREEMARALKTASRRPKWRGEKGVKDELTLQRSEDGSLAGLLLNRERFAAQFNSTRRWKPNRQSPWTK